VVCLKVLSDVTHATTERSSAHEALVHLSRQSFSSYLDVQQALVKAQLAKEIEAKPSAEIDELPIIRQLTSRARGAALDDGAHGDDADEEAELAKVVGNSDLGGKEQHRQKLSRIVQLTGFSDPVYAEALVDVHQFDVRLELTVHNQTQDTLQNLTLELATLGDLKLLERPTSVSLGPYGQKTIVAQLKVSSTENGAIFGSLVYEAGGKEIVVSLNEIHIDIIDYITPAHTDDANFRRMWQAFEWENKLAVQTTMTDLPGYLSLLLKATNMACLTPTSALEGDCGFLSANLYARSVFGEDALANVSLEQKSPDAPITGHIRIRSKTQGIAIALGEKIQQKQKG
jgi:coatomer subunit beta